MAPATSAGMSTLVKPTTQSTRTAVAPLTAPDRTFGWGAQLIARCRPLGSGSAVKAASPAASTVGR